jgi:hypothetical protein
MWTRKSESEIREFLAEQEAKRKSLLRPLLFASILTVISVIIFSLGYRGGWLRGGMVFVTNPSGLGLKTVFIGLFFFALFFAIAVYNQRRHNSLFSTSDSLLCRDCNEPSDGHLSARCECGGTLEPFAYFNWVEDETQKT